VTDPLPVPPPTRGRDRELVVGIFVIVGVIAVLTALFTLTDASTFRGRYIVTTNVPNAGGIRRGDPVQMRGVNIGRVQKFRISPAGVAIALEIEGEYGIPDDSHVELRSSGLLGGMVADIVPGSSTTMARGGSVIPGAMGQGLFDHADKLAGESQKVLERMQALLSQKTVTNVETSSEQLTALLKDLSELAAKQKTELTALTASLRRNSESLEKATSGPEIEDAIKRVDGVAKRLETLSDSLDRSSRSAETILGRIERGEGTFGKLSKDDSLYVNANEAVVNMNQTIQEMRRLTEDIRKQPKRYLKLSVF
jgi:phospholipid/cholesterol/gamma-HCH transport system substrate-binding protein